jgi:hypothetical protein
MKNDMIKILCSNAIMHDIMQYCYYAIMPYAVMHNIMQ